MGEIIGFLKKYFYTINKRTLVLISLLTAMLIIINYQLGLEEYLRKNNFFLFKLVGWYIVYLVAFGVSYLIVSFNQKNIFLIKKFIALLFIAPLLFAIKQSVNFTFHFSGNLKQNLYWNYIVYWPVLMLFILSMIFLIWKTSEKNQSFYGAGLKKTNWKPYLLMMFLMVPVIAVAATQPDFLSVYPKMKVLSTTFGADEQVWWKKLLFEISYGCDFISIEFFFRGLLVLAFLKWVNHDSILPMACFYCTIHFGKPLGECISSYFGGILLGIIVYNTRSVWGGLLVHLGIAWLMELGGFLGNSIYGIK